MRKKPTPAPEVQPDIAKLAEVVANLTHQVRQLALILDEVREDLVWAVRNDKFDCAGASTRYVENRLRSPPIDSEAVDDESRDDAEVDALDDSPVPPPPVRETTSLPKKADRSLFS